jgi:long-chain fatty acid transport protein
MAPLPRLRSVAAGLLVGVLLAAPARPAQATNATNLLGYSSAVTGMAGAGSVGNLDASLINTNPATLFLLPESRDPDGVVAAGIASVTLGVLQGNLHHTDAFGNDREGENNPYIGVHGAAAVRFHALPRLTFGAGLFSQSGLGAELRGLRTAFGTRDEVTSFERFLKLQTVVTYQATENLAIAAGPYLGYSDLTLHLFPRTSAPPGFAGLAIGDRCARNFGVGEPGSDCPWSVVGGAKAGFAYRVTPMVTIGAAYTSPAEFDYHDGRAELNLGGAGLGRVKYDVSVDGITHPQMVQAGLAVRPTPRWLLALDFTWHDWSVFEQFTIKLRHPNRAGAPERVDLTTTTDWRDQYVVAVGAAYELIRDLLIVRGGYNYATNPNPARTFTPAIQVPFQHHVTAGLGYRTGPLELDAGFVYAFTKTITYTNPEMPFGPDATDKPSGFSIDLTMGYRF